MEVYSVAFFGHRYIENIMAVEHKLEEHIQMLLKSYEYVEFLVGRNWEFDQCVSSAVLRVRKKWVTIIVSLCLYCLMPRRNIRAILNALTNIIRRLKYPQLDQWHIPKPRYRFEIGKWLTERTLLFVLLKINSVVLIKQLTMLSREKRTL